MLVQHNRWSELYGISMKETNTCVKIKEDKEEGGNKYKVNLMSRENMNNRTEMWEKLMIFV